MSQTTDKFKPTITVLISLDDCPVDPMEDFIEWRLITNNRRLKSYSKEWYHYFDEDGKPATIGMRKKLEVGTAFRVCYRDFGSGGTQLYITDDPSRTNAVLVWENDVKELSKNYEERQKYAKGCIDMYQQWCNGEVYGYSVECNTFRLDGVFDASDALSKEVISVLEETGHTVECIDYADSCWGFYGAFDKDDDDHFCSEVGYSIRRCLEELKCTLDDVNIVWKGSAVNYADSHRYLKYVKEEETQKEVAIEHAVYTDSFVV